MAVNNQSRMARRHSKKEKKRKGKGSKFNWKKFFIITGIVFGVLFLSVIGLFAYYISDAPPLNAENLSDPLSSKIYDRNGKLIVDLGQQKRTKISYDDIPKVLEDAVIATEDARFRDHFGIDIFRLVSAVWANITDGFGSQGASTITQQVVKNAFLTPEKTIKRKVQEQWLAIKLESEYSKDEILTMYLNKIHYGNSTYGVAKAAEVYLGKTDLHDLTLPEAALLAGIPQLPNLYDPFVHPENAEKRKNLVLDLMVKHGKITKEEAEEAKKVTVEEMVVDNYENNIKYADFLEKVVDEIQAKLGEDVDIYQDGLEIYTTLDVNTQEYVELLLSSSDNNPLKSYYIDDELQTAITVLDTKTGEILAIGGGRDSKQGIGADFNYAFQDGFQPGSTFKPIMDYGPFIEYEKASPYYQIKDEKYTYSWGKEINNWDGGYIGWNSMRYHLAKSRNIPALKIFHEVGNKKVEEFASKLGIPIPEEGVTEVDSIGGHIEPNTIQLAGAYAAFGNQGIFNEPHTVRKVVIGGQTIDFTKEPEIAMSDYTAFLISDMLKDVVEYGTGTAAAIPGLPIAAKTGTTNDDMDAWFAGYTTNFTISVWTGYPKSDDSVRGEALQIPKQMFKLVMQKISEGVETPDFVQPDSVVKVPIEKGTNPPKLASEFTPKSEIVYEWFVKGFEPKETSDKFSKVEPVKDLKAKYNEKKNTIEITWKYGKKDHVIFDVKAGIKNSELTSVAKTEDTKASLGNIEAGQTYIISVVAMDKENNENQSDPVQVTIEIPDNDFLDDFLDNPPDGEDDGDNGNSGNGNGNGNNNDNGNGNGNGDGNNGGNNGGTDEGNNGDNNQNGENGNNDGEEDNEDPNQDDLLEQLGF
jgi:penicillin-binding protein 1A